jgi:hypothetical protein
VLVLGLGALAGIAVTWLRGRRAGGQQAAVARRDLAVALALAACWAGIWVLYATYAWTAAPVLSTLQAARFYVPALGAISLLGAWLLVRAPRRQPVAAVTTLVVVAALFGLGGWAFHDMYQHPFGSQLIVVPGPGGTVELEPGPAAAIGGLAARPGRPGPDYPDVLAKVLGYPVTAGIPGSMRTTASRGGCSSRHRPTTDQRSTGGCHGACSRS